MDLPGWGPPLECFLAERFVPRHTPDVLASAIASCSAAGGEAPHFRLLQAIYVPDDETCFALLEATTAEDVARASAAYQLGFHRAKAALSIQRGRAEGPGSD